MRSQPRTAGGVAQELWADARQRSGSPENVLAVADELLTQLEVRLRRWIGAEGYAALLNRSVALALPQNAALLTVSDLHVGASDSSSSGKAEEYSESEISDAIIALLIVMMEQLGSIVGIDMAVRLVALSAPPITRDLASHDSNDTKS